MTVINTDYSTRDLQEEEIANLEAIDTKLAAPLTIGLPTGSATSLKQDQQTALVTTIEADTNFISNNFPSLGQAVVGSSIPVVLPASQITTLTPPAAITGFSTEATLSSLNSKVTAVNTGAVVISSSALPTNASTSALQTTGNASLSSIDSNISSIRTSASSIDSKTPALGQALAASSVPVVLTAAQITTLTPPAAITGFATSAKQDTMQTSLSSIDTKLTSPLTINLPSGASTSANQTTELASLSSIDGKLTTLNAKDFATQTTLAAQSAKLPAALGQTTMSASLAVTIASNQTSLSVDCIELPALTALADTVANPSLSAIATYGMVFDGTNWNRQKAGTLTASTNIGGMINVLPMGRYNGTSPVSLSTGDSAINQMNTRGHLKTTSLNGEPIMFRNEGANATLNIKSTAGRLYSFDCRNTNAATRFIQFWNTATIAGTGTLICQYPVSATSSRSFGAEQFTADGLAFSTGIAFGFSTTSGTYTAGLAADQTTQCVYV